MLENLKRKIRYSELAGISLLSKIAPSKRLKEAGQKQLAKKMKELRGVPMKLSQILSMSNDDTRAEAFDCTQSHITPMPPEEIYCYLNEHANGLSEKIVEISDKGLSASLGQVHQILLNDNQRYALKIRYFDSLKNMELDSDLFSMLTRTMSTFKEGFNLTDYQKTISDELLKELDYEHELETQQKFFEHFESEKNIIIPKVSQSDSGSAHIVMNWEEGQNIEAFCIDATEDQKMKAGNLLCTFLLQSFLKHGLVHSDPNPGNFAFRIKNNEVQLVVYDYGSCLEISEDIRLAFMSLFKEVKSQKGVVIPWLVAMGFNEALLLPIKDNLLAFLDMLFEPFLSDGRYDTKDWSRKERAANILGEQRWNFMTAAPANLMGLMRSIHGLFYYVEKLDCGIYAKPQLTKIFEEFETALSNIIPPILNSGPTYSKLSTQLEVRIFENEKQKIALSLPRTSIEDLENLMDKDVMENIQKQGVFLDVILEKARKNGYRAMDLFNINVNKKRYHVYLA